jgi:hypothetical protein
VSAEDDIEKLAKHLTPLRLRQAQYVFDALYLSAVLRRTGGNVTKAAEIAQVQPPAINRIIKRSNR